MYSTEHVWHRKALKQPSRALFSPRDLVSSCALEHKQGSKRQRKELVLQFTYDRREMVLLFFAALCPPIAGCFPLENKQQRDAHMMGCTLFPLCSTSSLLVNINKETTKATAPLPLSYTHGQHSPTCLLSLLRDANVQTRTIVAFSGCLFPSMQKNNGPPFLSSPLPLFISANITYTRSGVFHSPLFLLFSLPSFVNSFAFAHSVIHSVHGLCPSSNFKLNFPASSPSLILPPF